ncbi:hypothetical protein bgla_1g26480 [Burkholderia gladioli BSR3]|uniref:Uncharacterized protein n=1 Tax=Burkholderia gladioli (strain BSR3) TaxID=999541 RepID=F2L8P0_BURGS|nr:hypothetical protein bgla_1g26480 [Burkholderia gladioli BSR3]
MYDECHCRSEQEIDRAGALRWKPRCRSVSRLLAGGRREKRREQYAGVADLPGRRIRPRKPGTSRGKPAQNARKIEPSKRLSVLYRGPLDKRAAMIRHL